MTKKAKIFTNLPKICVALMVLSSLCGADLLGRIDACGDSLNCLGWTELLTLGLS